MREIILKKRYPHSREEDITDAFMRGYEKGKADRPQKWIPTCDRLPNDSDYYLVTLVNAFEDTEICIAWYAHEKDYSGETGWREITDSDFVTAWMPLPKPWKGADDAQQ